MSDNENDNIETIVDDVDDVDDEDDDDDDNSSGGAYENDDEEVTNKALNSYDSDQESDMSNEDSTHVEEDVYNTFEKNEDFIQLYHPEELHLSFDEIHKYSLIKRNEKDQIVDPYHITYPLLSKYEKTKIIGLRVTQLNHGAIPFIDIKESYLDKYLIAERELKEKKIPYIIKRPIPNGKFEYWNIKDLEIV
tara:strand:+ start:726 stop:1301 length:576 start_codon:yes stop_codon:yes gene_type:complete